MGEFGATLEAAAHRRGLLEDRVSMKGIVARQRGCEFERTRTPIVGQVVRKYERIYYVGEDRNEVTEHCVVIDPGPGQSAVVFTVPESA